MWPFRKRKQPPLDAALDLIIDMTFGAGPGGSTICFQCAFATPEDEETTKASMRALMGAAAAVSPTGVVAIGTPDGPMAFNPKGPQ